MPWERTKIDVRVRNLEELEHVGQRYFGEIGIAMVARLSDRQDVVRQRRTKKSIDVRSHP